MARRAHAAVRSGVGLLVACAIPSGQAAVAERSAAVRTPQIVSISVATGRVDILSHSTTWDVEPAMSPDGRTIAFTRRRSDGRRLVAVMSARGTQQRSLAEGGRPVWSPRGHAIAYEYLNPSKCPPGSMRCGGAVELRTVSATDGTVSTVIESSREPSWQRDARRLACGGDVDVYGHSRGIFVVDLRSRARKRVSAPGFATDAAWSPQDRWIAYATGMLGELSGRRVVVVRADGTRRRPLGPGWRPAWSRDGRRLAWQWLDARGVSRLVVHEIGARGKRFVARDIETFAWAPNSRRLAYVSGGVLYVVNRDGRSRRRVARVPGGLADETLVFSPDGRRVVLAARPTPR